MAKILVIEDDSIIREEVCEWLQFDGHEAIGAANGWEGVDAAIKHVPDLILSDVMMPGKDGYRVLLDVRSNPRTALIPFVFLTARQERNDVRHGMEMGADDYVAKPFTHAELIGAVNTRLARRQLFEEQCADVLQTARKSLFQTLPHELRTPLSGVLGAAEMLAQGPNTLQQDEVLELADIILRSGQRLYRLVENHLLYAHLEMQAVDPSLKAALRNACVGDAARVIREASERAAHDNNRSADLKVTAQSSPLRIQEEDLRKIVIELVDNAFKFSMPGNVVTVTSALNGEYVLHIVDMGRGMSAHDLDRIGARTQFQRNLYEQQGEGMGLAIAQRLVELYGGRLDIVSEIDHGTTMTVHLPAK